MLNIRNFKIIDVIKVTCFVIKNLLASKLVKTLLEIGNSVIFYDVSC